MTVTDQQLRAITYLAIACRPAGAARWDEAGTFANLAKVRDRSLAAVTIAAIQAAEDRKVISPGVIPKPGPHWRAPESAPLAEVILFDRGAVCATCNRTKAMCEEVARKVEEEPHRFESVADAGRRRAAALPTPPPAAAVARDGE